MEINVEEQNLSVVLKEAKFDVVISAEAPLQVNVGESAKIDVGQAIDYIKSGEAEINAAVTAGTNAFNTNAIAKTNDFNQNATNKTTAYNNNASAKITDYNDNATAKLNAYNQNATDKTNAFNSNASDKTIVFNNNAIAKTGDFDTNATNKTNTFNQNATDKTTAFNNNATSKTNDFNDNYTAKKALIDAQVGVATGAATTAKQYAIGDPSEPAGNSAKYWAEQAHAELVNKQDKLTAGDFINIDANNNITTTYTAGTGIAISSSGVISNTQTSAEWGNITGTLSNQTDLQNALNAKYDASNPNGYTSNVGTVTSVNNTSPDGSGNVTITIPDPLPSQTGQSGKYLTTDGTNPSWNTITIPSVDIDGKSITRNASDELQTIGVINQNDTTTALKIWSGDEADLPVTKDSNTFYATEETVSVSLLDTLYPVGSIYITTNATCPLSTLIAGSTWVLQSSGVVTGLASTAPCKGNGKNIGWTTGSTEYAGVGSTYSGVGIIGIFGNDQTSTLPATGAGIGYQPNANVMYGVTTNASKSGIIADTSSLAITLAVNIFERTA